MVRIAYFGTDGCPGHHVIPIRGKFTEEDIKVIESIDCDDFYKVFDVMRFKIAEFKGWTILGIPASLDDHRPLEASCSIKLLKEPVEERISALLKDRKKKVVSIFYIILIMVVCKAVMSK